MFRRASYLGIIFVFSISAIWAFYLCFLKKESSLHKEKSRFSSTISEPSLAKQARSKVRKEIWVSQPGNIRLQNRIESEKSLLILQPKGTSIEVIEQLENIRCWSQEKIEKENQNLIQQMRFLEAKEGTYRYQSQTFQAEKANLSLYKIAGNSLPIQLHSYRPFLKGTAEEISFTVQKGVPFFQAHEFHASLTQGAPK